MTPPLSGKHLLMTADAGPVWACASSLARAMAERGMSVTLVTLGPAPSPDQFVPLLAYDDIELDITDLQLEWQDPLGDDRQRVMDYLGSLDERLRPDIVHLNGYREACAEWRAPLLVAAHSCVGSWWRACRGSAPDAAWQDYLADVAAGLSAADRWVAPTAAFRDRIEQLYAPPRRGEVIFDGIDLPAQMDAKQPFILADGRLWDEAKNIGAVSAIAQRLQWPVRIAGELRQGHAAGGVEWLGKLSQANLQVQMRRAGIFVAPAVYEPFGLSVLEAAANGCALVLADIASLRELWDGAALFVDPRDSGALQGTLSAVVRDAGMRKLMQWSARQRAAQYSLAAKADAYERLYRDMLAVPLRKRPAQPFTFSEVRA